MSISDKTKATIASICTLICIMIIAPIASLFITEDLRRLKHDSNNTAEIRTGNLAISVTNTIKTDPVIAVSMVFV